MADNITAPASGSVLATDDIGGVHYPRTKISVGADGAASDVSSDNPLPTSVATLPLPTGASTAAKQDATIAAIGGLTGTEYETVAASQSDQALGAAGATGDLLVGVLIVPATTSPGAVQIKDGAGSAITVFTGGADSVSTLHPFFVPLGARSAAGAWQVTTGANVSAVAVGTFT